MSEQLKRAAAVGDKDTISVLRALGIDVFPATTAGDIRGTIKDLEEKGYPLIFIPETEATLVEEFIRNYENTPYPIILTIPDGRGRERFAIQKILRNMERTIGSSAALK